MTMFPEKRLGLCMAWAVVAAVLLYGGNAAAADVSVCIDTSSPTASTATRLAQAVASQEGRTLRVHRFDSSGDDDGFSLKNFHELASKDCDLVLGFPIDTDATRVELEGLKASTPYGHTGFVLVTPRHDGAAATLDRLPGGTAVAVVYLTTPNVYFADHPNLRAEVTLSNDAALEALKKGTVGAAMLWRPAVVRYLADHHLSQRYALHELRQPHAAFNLVALYDAGHAKAAGAFEHAVATLHSSGALARILSPYVEPGAASPATAAKSVAVRRPFRGHPDAARGDCATKAKKPAATAARPALYTEAQATSGKQKFLDNCAVCHGQDLGGDAGPALKGPHFAPVTSDYHVGDIFTIVTHNMPATQPGSLPHGDYVEIMAFLLQQNGYPAGSQALTYEEAMQSKVKFISVGK